MIDAFGLLSIVLLPLIAAVLAGSSRGPGSFERTDDGLVLHLERGLLRIQVRDPEIFRITVTQADDFSTREGLVVLPPPNIHEWHLIENEDFLVIRTVAAEVKVSRHDGSLAVSRSDGRLILRAAAPSAESFRPIDDLGDQAWSVRQRFTLTPAEGIFGLGQYQDGVMNWRGETVLLVQANMIAAIPFLISTRGCGLLWDNYSKTVFSDGNDGMSLWSEVADEIDYYVVAGDRPDDAIAGYRRLTGKAPLYARSAYGYWQSKEHYQTQQEVLDTAAEYRRRGLPIDNIIQDWSFWGEPDQFSGMIWDSLRYPDPVAMVRELHERYNLHFMAVIWPALGVNTEIHREMKARGFLYPMSHWSPSLIYDAYNPDARALYWRYAKKGIYDVGLDAWWMDATEPEFRCTDDRYVAEQATKANDRNALGSMARYLNTYSLQTTRGIFENQRALEDGKRVFILTRSAFAGQQRYATTLWSGDLWASWQVFRDQISAGLNASMAGLPYWTSDIGGFVTNHRFPDGVNDPAYRELYARWYQFGAFCPIFRSHGTNTPREIWQFGEPGSWAYDALVEADRLRYRLLPYIYSLAWSVYRNDDTMMRGLALDFPEDPRVYDLNGEYTFGRAMLVSPVTRPMRHPPEHAQEWIPSRNLFNETGTEQGLRLDFFHGIDFDSLVSSRRTDVFNITGTGALPEELANAPYSLRYSGSIKPDESGLHRFVLTTDSGVRLRLDDRLIVDQWDNQEPLVAEPEVEMKAGRNHTLELEYRQPTPNAGRLILEWITPTQHQARHASGKRVDDIFAGRRRLVRLLDR